MAPEPQPIAAGLFRVTPGGPRLIAGRCAACADLHFPAAPTCPYCAHDHCDETLVGPEGRLRLFTAITTRPPGYTGAVPFGFGVVELTGTGLEVIARLTESRPERLHRDMPMHLVIDMLANPTDGAPVATYAFSPVEAA